jgi:uncharacterized protein (TIGR03790 family)
MRNRLPTLVAAGLLLAIPAVLSAAGPGDEVIVIYNSRVPESKEVAEYYASRRHVPASQVLGFSMITGDEMSRGEFRDALQKPLAEALQKKKLWNMGSVVVPGVSNQATRVEWRVKQSAIRYAVVCYGVPFRISEDVTIKETVPDSARPEMRRNCAAVDSELVLLPCIEQRLPISGPLNNPFFGATNTAVFHPTNGVLVVGRLDGPSVAVARSLVDKALIAETNGLWGRAYFDVRGATDPTYKPGDDWINGAAEICRRLGFETIVDQNPGTFPPEFPLSQVAIYCGWYEEHVNGPFTRPNVEFMPGAFAYHLHSFSAASLRSPIRNWVGPLLARGATASMGCVDEPYLGGTPQLAIFMSRFIYYGFDLGEAAIASQPVLSWQTTVLGDPLYRPFGKSSQQLHEELAARKSRLLEWSLLRLVNMNLARGVAPAEITRSLEATEDTRQSAVLSEKLADLYAAAGKPSSAVDTYERALKLASSPQQRIRLRLVLAGKLSEMERDPEAAEHLAGLLQENPDYPDRLGIYHRLLALAQKLGKHEAATNYSERIKELTPRPASGTNK